MSGFVFFVIPSSNCFWNFSIKFLLTFILYWRLVHSKKQTASQPNLISYFSYHFKYNNYRKPIHIPTNNSSFFSFLFFFFFNNFSKYAWFENYQQQRRFLSLEERSFSQNGGSEQCDILRKKSYSTKKEILLCKCNKVRKGRKLHGIITYKSSTIYRLSCNCFQTLWHDDAFNQMHLYIYIFFFFLLFFRSTIRENFAREIYRAH